MGETLETGGSDAQGDLTGVGGAGGFATRVGFSAEAPPFRISPLPDGRPGFTDGELATGAEGGAGEWGFSMALASFTTGCSGMTGVSSTCGIVVLVPSAQVRASGASQSSSSSSMSAQVDWPFVSSA